MDVEWAPTVADVGALLRARTKDTNGVEQGTFTALTRPTAEQVQAIIDVQAADLVDSFGEIPVAHGPTARRVVILGAAMDVELGYYPEQINSGRSPYPQLEARYTVKLRELTTDLGGDSDAPGAGAAPSPTYSFPTAPIIGWEHAPW